MVRITIDEDLKKQITAADGLVELCDQSGEIVAQVVIGHRIIPPDWVPVTPPISDEALQDRLASKEPGLTTSEVIAHLKSLP